MKNRAKMPRSERAKQFMPFAAVSGLDEALEEKRRQHGCEPMRELSEEQLEALNARFAELRPGDEVKVEYYHDFNYRTVSGSVEQIDAVFRTLRVGGTDIAFDMISEVI